MFNHSTSFSYWPLDGPLLSKGVGGSLLVLEGGNDIGIEFISPWSLVDWRNSEILGLGCLWDNELVLERFLRSGKRLGVVNNIVINTEVWNKVISLWSSIFRSINWSPGNSKIGLSLLGEGES